VLLLEVEESNDTKAKEMRDYKAIRGCMPSRKLIYETALAHSRILKLGRHIAKVSPITFAIFIQQAMWGKQRQPPSLWGTSERKTLPLLFQWLYFWSNNWKANAYNCGEFALTCLFCVFVFIESEGTFNSFFYNAFLLLGLFPFNALFWILLHPFNSNWNYGWNIQIKQHEA